MIAGKTISIIIPCKNEAKTLPGVLRAVPKYIDEVVVVDNNSTDQTISFAKRAGAKVVKEPREIDGIGYGFAHQTGLSSASGDFLVGMDGDGSYPVDQIGEIIKIMLKKNLDFVSCYRYNGKRQRDIALSRYLGGKVVVGAFNLLFHQKLNDLLTGMWVVKRSALRYLNLTSGDWNFSVDIKSSAILSPKVKFAEIAIPYHDRDLGDSKQSLTKTGVSHLAHLVTLWQKHALS